MLSKVLDEGLKHLSSDAARIAKRELMKTIPLLYERQIIDLQHFKDCHIGLWATDIEPKDKTDFFRIGK